MSNRRRAREAHGGIFTRPRSEWRGKRRGNRLGYDVSGRNMMAASLARLTSWQPPAALLTRRGGDR